MVSGWISRMRSARVARRAVQLGHGLSPKNVASLRREVDALTERVAQLEAALQESRQLSRRIAEVTDMVTEVLLPATDRDDERLRAALTKYESQL